MDEPGLRQRRVRSRILPEVEEEPFYHEIEWTARRCFQMLLGAVFLLPIRILLCSIILFPAVVICAVMVLFSLKRDGIYWMRPWQKLVISMLARYGGHALLWSLGFTSVKVVGKLAPFQEAPIAVIGPHTSIYDAFFTGTFVQGCYMSLKENMRTPFLGSLMSVSETILIDDRNCNDLESILQERLSSNESWQPVVVFPEGTVHSGRSLIEFKKGAFVPGLPIQPIVYRIGGPPGWTIWSYHHSMIRVILHTLCVLHHSAEVHFLPVYTPSASERQNPQLFAGNVRNTMANYCHLPVSKHGRNDMLLVGLALDLGLPHWSGNVEYGMLRDHLGLNFQQLKDLLKKFAGYKKYHDGYLTCSDFQCYYKWPVSGDVVKLFNFFTLAGKEKITFRDIAIAQASAAFSELQDPAFVERAFRYLSQVSIPDSASKDIVDRAITMKTLAMAARLHPDVSNDEVGAAAFAMANHFLDANPLKASFDDFRAVVSDHPELLMLVSFAPELNDGLLQ